jgi:hypothetical protein
VSSLKPRDYHSNSLESNRKTRNRRAVSLTNVWELDLARFLCSKSYKASLSHSGPGEHSVHTKLSKYFLKNYLNRNATLKDLFPSVSSGNLARCAPAQRCLKALNQPQPLSNFNQNLNNSTEDCRIKLTTLEEKLQSLTMCSIFSTRFHLKRLSVTHTRVFQPSHIMAHPHLNTPINIMSYLVRKLSQETRKWPASHQNGPLAPIFQQILTIKAATALNKNRCPILIHAIVIISMTWQTNHM